MTKHVKIRKTRDKTRKNPCRFESVNTHQGTAAGEGSRGERGRRRRRRRRRYRAWYLRRLAMWQSRKSITACRSRPRRQRARASPPHVPPKHARAYGSGRVGESPGAGARAIQTPAARRAACAGDCIVQHCSNKRANRGWTPMSASMR